MNPSPYDRDNRMDGIGENNGIHYFNCLYSLFSEGVQKYAEDTPRRSKFVENNQHLFAGTFLCSMFAYLESTLGGRSKHGSTWITRHGGRATRELECLRTVRNAFVHSNSHISDLSSVTECEKEQLRTFIQDLNAGKIKDDRGNRYPCYMSISDDDIVSLNAEALRIIWNLGWTLSH